MKKAAAILLLFASGSQTSAETATNAQILNCSAVFEARAIWIDGLGGRKDTEKMLLRYGEILLEAIDATLGPSDWGMSTGFGHQSDPTMREERDSLALSVITAFAERGARVGPLPLCVEDQICLTCTELLSEIVK